MKWILFLSIVGCAGMMDAMKGQQNYAPDNVQVSQVENAKTKEAFYGKVKISYTAAVQLKADADKKISNELLGDKEAKALKSSIPKGGRIVVHIFRPTVETASTANFNYVLRKNGKEILRKEGIKGIQSVASTPSHYGPDGSYWTNIDLIDVPEEVRSSDKLELFVADRVYNERDVFTLEFVDLSKISKSE